MVAFPSTKEVPMNAITIALSDIDGEAVQRESDAKYTAQNRYPPATPVERMNWLSAGNVTLNAGAVAG